MLIKYLGIYGLTLKDSSVRRDGRMGGWVGGGREGGEGRRVESP